MTLADSLWVRLVDVAAALTARRYARDPDVVIAVADDVCAWNTGRYRLSADGCVRTRAAADLELDVSSLAAAYLGGTTLRMLAAAGRVRELTPGAVARASAAFRARSSRGARRSSDPSAAERRGRALRHDRRRSTADGRPILPAIGTPLKNCDPDTRPSRGDPMPGWTPDCPGGGRAF